MEGMQEIIEECRSFSSKWCCYIRMVWLRLDSMKDKLTRQQMTREYLLAVEEFAPRRQFVRWHLLCESRGVL
jgi:hypothetical protein